MGTNPANDRWIAAFLDAQAAEAGAARNTLLAYGRDLLDFAGWLTGHGSNLAGADRALIEGYLAFCTDAGLAPSTRARRLSSIRQLFRFAQEEGWRNDHPAQRIAGPKMAMTLPDTLTVDEVDRLLDAARSHGRTVADQVRNRCLMEMLYATGLRVTELVGLPVAAARGDPRVILVRGKGGRERLVPLSPPAREALTAWIALRDATDAAAVAKGATPSRFLFPGRGATGHVTREGFYLMIQDFAAAAGIGRARVTPHVLRHAFATHLLAGGADLRVIQTLLGHADIATTEIYTHVLDGHLKALVLGRHPLARKT